jgi:hypothetical protein
MGAAKLHIYKRTESFEEIADILNPSYGGCRYLRLLIIINFLNSGQLYRSHLEVVQLARLIPRFCVCCSGADGNRVPYVETESTLQH